MSRRSDRFERRSPERAQARHDQSVGPGPSLRAERRAQSRLETMIAQSIDHACQQTIDRTPPEPYDPVRHPRNAILGRAQVSQPWPYTPAQVEELCRGLVLQLDPFNPDIEPAVASLSIITMDLPALHDHRGMGLTSGTLTVRNGRVSVQPPEEPQDAAF